MSTPNKPASPSEVDILKLALSAVQACRRSRGLGDDVAGLPSAEDQAQEVWLKWHESKESIRNSENPDGWIRMTARNLVFDNFRRLELDRESRPTVARDEVVSTNDPAAGTQLGLLFEQLAPRERQTLAYYFSNQIPFPNDDRKVLTDQAADLQMKRESLSKSLSRIREAARAMNCVLALPDSGTRPPVTFNADDFLSIRPLVDESGEVVLEIGLPATLNAPLSRKAPERTLLSDLVFQTLLPISLSHVLDDRRDVSPDDDLLALRRAAAALRDDLADVPRFELVLCQTLQLLLRVLVDQQQRDSADDLLAELRTRLQSAVVSTSPRAVELHAAVYDIEAVLADQQSAF